MNRDFVYHSFTRTLCSKCEKVIDGKIIYSDKNVFILKQCPICGEHIELLEEDKNYHLKKALFDKEGTKSSIQTEYKDGCPYDCGLCPSHDQHSCIGIIEITKRCNLSCEMCFANSGKGKDLTLTQIEKMMDFYMEAENENAEILQISGGEPTLHKDILRIIEIAKNKGFRYVMLNTNGIRIAEDEEFAKKLSEFKGGFEVYLQFDGFNDEVYEKMRGKALCNIKKQAISNLSKYNVPTTLVMTVQNGVNDNYIGEMIVFGMKEKCVRGINFQPIAYYGSSRCEPNRITLSGVLSRIEKQTDNMIRISDFIPLPCNVERVAITYLFKVKDGFKPITRETNIGEYKEYINNTFMFTIEDTVKNLKEDSRLFNLCSCCDFLGEIKKFLPANFLLKSKSEKMRFVDENTFRISVSSFLDKYNFDMKSMQKECVHIITPDLRRIPFSAFNIIHRKECDHFYEQYSY